MSETPRIAPGTVREIGVVNAVVADLLGRMAGTHAPNVFTTLAHHRSLFRRWLWFAGALMPGGTLPRADTELLILRVAHTCECEYEWGHHVRIGRAAGLSDEAIEAARGPIENAPWTPRQRTLVRAADELLADRRMSDGTWAALREHLDERSVIELCFVVGNYQMLAMALNTFRVQPDRAR